MPANKKTNPVKGLETKLNNLEAQIRALSKGKRVMTTTTEEDLEHWVGQYNDLKAEITKLKLTANVPHTSDSVTASKTAEKSRHTGTIGTPFVIKATPTPSDIARVKRAIVKPPIIDLATDDEAHEENDDPEPNRLKRTREYVNDQLPDNYNVPRDAFEEMQRRLTFLETQRSVKSSRFSHSHRSPNSNRHLDNGGSIATPQNLCIAPPNIDGMPPELDPTRTLDARQILWPHITPELIKAILANRVEITKLHLLTPADFRPGIDFRSLKRKHDDDDDDDEVKTARKLARISKQFPTKEVWIATFCVWKGVKAYYDSSNKEFGPSTDMHIAKIGKLCSKYPWEHVLNYELAFFQRYHTITTPVHVWAILDTQLLMDHIYMGISQHGATNPMNPKGSIPDIFCARFASGKCYSSACRFQHRCTYDQTRCNGPHAAIHCPLNPNKIPANDRGNGRRQGKDNNPNFAPVGQAYTQRQYGGDRSPRRNRD